MALNTIDILYIVKIFNISRNNFNIIYNDYKIKLSKHNILDIQFSIFFKIKSCR